MTGESIRSEYRDPAGMPAGQRDYDISCSCRNYIPKSSVRTLNMGDYSSCDSCTHLRSDMKCGLARQTLS